MKLSLCVFMLVCVGAAFAVTSIEKEHYGKFAEFIRKFDRQYESIEEFNYRFMVFEETLARIERRNFVGQATYGITPFSDMTTEEFKQKYLISPPEEAKSLEVEELTYVAPNLPKSFDWRNKGVVTPVKNQEQCGSCWAFSATENIESQWAIAGNDLVELAPQQLVDCVTADYGCNGGLPGDAFQQVLEWSKAGGGMEKESSYPYVGYDTSCSYNKNKAVAHIDSWKRISSNEDALKTYLYQNGPVSIAVDAADGGWMDYYGGVLMASQCGSSLDHAVLLVGWGVDSGTEYWIVRNSWGSFWGIDGYIWLEYGKDTCGLANQPSSSKVNAQIVVNQV